jgi:hypothetical protein
MDREKAGLSTAVAAASKDDNTFVGWQYLCIPLKPKEGLNGAPNKDFDAE